MAKAYRRFGADRVVAEINQGGDVVTPMLKSIDENLPVSTVRATRGKYLRAEPVTALYERGRVAHAGWLPYSRTRCAILARTGFHRTVRPTSWMRWLGADGADAGGYGEMRVRTYERLLPRLLHDGTRRLAFRANLAPFVFELVENVLRDRFWRICGRLHPGSSFATGLQ